MIHRLLLLLALLPFASRAADASLLATLTNPVSIVFNNAYKGTVEENEKAAAADPHSPVNYVLSLIASATGTLDVCVYDFSDPEIVAALLDSAGRGVQVRVVTETENTFDHENPGQLRESIQHLNAAKIPVVSDERGGLMHNKFIIADGRTVWFGSMNLTHNALFRDNNNSLFVRSAELAGVFERQFDHLFTKREFGVTDQLAAPPVVRVGDAEFTIHFSPDGGAQKAILAALAPATNSIRFMVFAFTDREIGGLLAKKKKAGLAVEGVFDECQIDQYSEFRWLGKQGVKEWPDGNQALLHHKVMIIDDRTVCCGSYNFTKSAEQKNNETSVILRSPRIAAEFRAEFDRLVYASEHNRPVPPYDHPACQHDRSHADANKPAPRR